MLRMMQPSTKCQNGLVEVAQVQAGDKLADPKLTAVTLNRNAKREHYNSICHMIVPERICSRT